MPRPKVIVSLTGDIDTQKRELARLHRFSGRFFLRPNRRTYVKQEKNKIGGLVILSAERRELSIVIIDGEIDPAKISELGGNFGIPSGLPKVGGSSKDSATE